MCTIKHVLSLKRLSNKPMSNEFSNVLNFVLSSNSPVTRIRALGRIGDHFTLVWMQGCFKILGVKLKGQWSQLWGISTIQLGALKNNYS